MLPVWHWLLDQTHFIFTTACTLLKCDLVGLIDVVCTVEMVLWICIKSRCCTAIHEVPALLHQASVWLKCMVTQSRTLRQPVEPGVMMQATQTSMFIVERVPSLCPKQSQAWVGDRLQWLLSPSTIQRWPPPALSCSRGALTGMEGSAMLLLTPSLHRASKSVSMWGQSLRQHPCITTTQLT